MNQFSVFNYENLSDALKTEFNKTLSQKLLSFLSEIKNDTVLSSSAIDDFAKSLGAIANASVIVSDLYSRITSGIQVGSGNQNLFLSILNAFVESWDEINGKKG